MLKIDSSRQATKFLKRVQPKHGKQIARKIQELRRNPRPHDSRPLKGRESVYRRADVGEYRIVYRVEGDTLRVYIVGRRNDSDVYRRLERFLDA